MEGMPEYAKCINIECEWNGCSFAPPPDSKGKRRCPACGFELKPWEARQGEDPGTGEGADPGDDADTT